MPKSFASGQILSLAFDSAQGLPNVPVGLPPSSIVTELKLAFEQSGARATGGEERLLSEEEHPRSRRVLVVAVAVVVGGRKVPVGAGGRKVAVNAGGTKVAVAVAVAVAVEFVATALMMLSVGWT